MVRLPRRSFVFLLLVVAACGGAGSDEMTEAQQDAVCSWQRDVTRDMARGVPAEDGDAGREAWAAEMAARGETVTQDGSLPDEVAAEAERVVDGLHEFAELARGHAEYSEEELAENVDMAWLGAAPADGPVTDPEDAVGLPYLEHVCMAVGYQDDRQRNEHDGPVYVEPTEPADGTPDSTN